MYSLNYTTQNHLLMNNLILFYNKDDNIEKMISIINGSSNISLRIVDWFATNYCKKYYILYNIQDTDTGKIKRFKVYDDYKLKLKAYSKKRFDPFCRWERISIPYKDGKFIETTIGQLNFFKWAFENKVIDFIEENYQLIEKDMNTNNSTSKKKNKKIKIINQEKKEKNYQSAQVKVLKKKRLKSLYNLIRHAHSYNL